MRSKTVLLYFTLVFTYFIRIQAQELPFCEGRSKESFKSGIYLGYKFSGITDTSEYYSDQAKFLFSTENVERHLAYSILYELGRDTESDYNVKVYDARPIFNDKSEVVNYFNHNSLINYEVSKDDLFSELMILDSVSVFDDFSLGFQDEENEGVSINLVEKYLPENFHEFEIVERIKFVDGKFIREHILLIIYKQDEGIGYKLNREYYALNLLDESTIEFLREKTILRGNKKIPFLDWIKSGEIKAKLSFIFDNSGMQNFFEKGKSIPSENLLDREYYLLGACIQTILSAEIRKK